MSRRRKGEPPQYRLHKPTGQAVVTLNGRDHYLGKHNSPESREKYHRLLATAAMLPTAPAVAPKAKAAVAALTGAFWNYAKEYYSGPQSHGQRGRFRTAIKVLLKVHGSTPIVEFGPLALATVQSALTQLRKRDGRPIVRAYCNALLDCVVRVFRWGVARELVPVSVLQALETVEPLKMGHCDLPESEPVVSVDDPIVEATLPHLPPMVADMVRLQRLTGMRPSEVFGLCPSQINRKGDTWVYVPPKHKTTNKKKRRQVFIGPQGQAILSPYLLRPADSHCFTPYESEMRRLTENHAKRKTPLSCGNSPDFGFGGKRRPKEGRPYTRTSYARAIRRACTKAWPYPKAERIVELQRLRKRRQATPELNAEYDQLIAERKAWKPDEHWFPYRLRHTAGTKIREQFGLEAAQVSLGHGHAKVTEIYAERNAKLAAEVARKMG